MYQFFYVYTYINIYTYKYIKKKYTYINKIDTRYPSAISDTGINIIWSHVESSICGHSGTDYVSTGCVCYPLGFTGRS